MRIVLIIDKAGNQVDRINYIEPDTRRSTDEEILIRCIERYRAGDGMDLSEEEARGLTARFLSA